ncbi:phosphoribosylanthranilate isomerase [Hoeflea poritis]|uniref:N-(5'-phosphoribosyl)anthranilate isomerase n=1 Tax=Hoeflea poritis TaxID=2993659 RepID=A0ABT4VME7_9HYPH|nr:phosphoribosylanthranilate isomerase [Hoeflea poritis]MDA4845302.1 phosphoribosylanthranilate isomerase [Hoeflea poritis]
MSVSVKICGLKTQETLEAAIDGGASHVGFIFFAKSPRNIALKDAGLLADRARGRARNVAVSVNADDETLDAIVSEVRPDMLQLHGSESPERVAAVKARYGLPVMKAVALKEQGDLRQMEPYQGVADRFLFEARPPAGSELPGGNGVPFDWTILSTIDPDIDYMLSGGLDAENIGDALAATGARGVDLSSGVESAPGQKDIKRIAEFFEALRSAERAAA